MDVVALDTTLEIRFEREGIDPSSIPMSALARAFEAINRLAFDRLKSESAPAGGEDALRLTQVRSGSAIYSCVAPPIATPRLRLVGLSLSDPEAADDLGQFLRPIHDLSQIARSLNCSITLCEPGDEPVVLARIVGDSYRTMAETAFSEGETEIAGTVKRVGGVKKTRCGLRVGFQHDLLFCEVATADVARRLGRYLYQDVIVRGTATWVRKNWRYYSFKIKEVARREPHDLADALQALRQAGGHYWDQVDDPESFLKEVRGES